MTNNVIVRKWKNTGLVKVDNLSGITFTGESGAHTFRIQGIDADGQKQPITGAISGKFWNKNTNITTPLSGTIEDGEAVVTLDAPCYVYGGLFSLMLFATNGSTVSCIYCGVGKADVSQSDTIAYPTAAIPDIVNLVNELQTILDNWPEDYSQLQSDVSSLKSAVTEQTRNLITGVVLSKTIESNGTYWNSNSTDVYYAPVEEGKSYYVSVEDASGLVCAFYNSAPATSGQSYNSSRTIQSSKVIVAPITGYIAFRATKDTTPQIEEGTQPTEYIRPVSAVDAIVREQTAKNTSDISETSAVVDAVTSKGNVFDAVNVVEGYWVAGSTGNTLSYVSDSNACYFSIPVIGKNNNLSISVVNFPSWAIGDNVGRIVRASDLKIYTPVYGHGTPIDTITFTGSWTETNTDMVLYINSTIADKDKMAVYINDVVTQYTPFDGEALSIKNSPLYGKKLCCNGDSIMYGAGSTGGFASILAAKYGMTLQNIAVSGGTIASGTTDSGTNRHWIAATMSNLANDGDYYIIEGGLNDYSLNVPLFTDGQTDVRNNISTTQPSDLTVFSEAMESLCYDLVVNHTEKKKGFVFPHKISWMDWTTNSLSRTYLDYKDVQKKILKKWGIPFLDLSEVSGMDTVFNAIASAYTSSSDRTHPNANGYLKFYVPHIERFMERL